MLSSVLEYYLSLAKEEKVAISYQIALPPSRLIDPLDMTVLLGNILENALEALRQVDSFQKELSLKIAPAKDSLLIRIMNTNNEKQEEKNQNHRKRFFPVLTDRICLHNPGYIESKSF